MAPQPHKRPFLWISSFSILVTNVSSQFSTSQLCNVIILATHFMGTFFGQIVLSMPKKGKSLFWIFFLYIIHTYFIFRGHGNKSCNLIGSSPSQYFPISAHGPSTSQIPLPFFINIPRFAGWAVFFNANTSVTTSSQLMNPLLSLSQIILVDKKILVSEWIFISNSVITLVDKRPKNRLQFILIVHKKYLEN